MNTPNYSSFPTSKKENFPRQNQEEILQLKSSKEEIQLLKSKLLQSFAEIQSLKKEILRLNGSQKNTKPALPTKPKQNESHARFIKKAKSQISLLPPEKLFEFHQKLRDFHELGKQLTLLFPQKGKLSLEQLEQKSENWIENETSFEIKLAIKLSLIIERGKLQSLADGQIWQKHQLADFIATEEIERLFFQENLSLNQFIILFQLLQIGNPFSKNKIDWKNALIKEISLRANV